MVDRVTEAGAKNPGQLGEDERNAGLTGEHQEFNPGQQTTLTVLGMEAQEGEAFLRACTVIPGLESQVTQLHKKTAL